ncbi:AzlC family ABC transporter permease [Carnobacterium viridans]|nr:AzlC family ABC transporter permease [Carnobacterium viridans]UDE94858.1 AzlC family ABC transporter permease [Carnobacterium viridans]
MKKQDWMDGLKVIYPVMISYVPLGLAGGMVLYDAGFNAVTILAMSLLVFGGAAQFMAASMVSMGASIPAIITMTFFLNLRHLLMSSSMSSFIKKTSLPFTLFSVTL